MSERAGKTETATVIMLRANCDTVRPPANEGAVP